jgi:hypothetical protein
MARPNYAGSQTTTYSPSKYKPVVRITTIANALSWFGIRYCFFPHRAAAALRAIS